MKIAYDGVVGKGKLPGKDNSSVRLTLGPQERLKRSGDLARVFDAGRTAIDAWLRVRMAPNTLGLRRLGVTVSTRNGPSVQRNRIKRLCREAWRLSKADLPADFDYVLMPRPGRSPTVEQLRESVVNLARRIAKEYGQSANPS